MTVSRLSWPFRNSIRQPRRQVIRLGAITLGVTAIYFVVQMIWYDLGRVQQVEWTVRPIQLVLATAFETTLLLGGVWLWSRILAQFEGPALPFSALLGIWAQTTVAKYAPGAIWPFVVTAEMADQVESTRTVLPASFLLHSAFTLSGALTIAGVFGTQDALTTVHLPLGILGGGCAAALALVHPTVLNSVVRAGARAARRAAPQWRGTWPVGIGILALYITLWVGYGAAFNLVLSALCPIPEGAWRALVGINALAFTVGFVAIFAPGGVGVREVALVVLLAPLIPSVHLRVIIAAASRLWLITTEAIGGVIALGVWQGTRHRATRMPIAASKWSALRPPAERTVLEPQNHHAPRIIRGVDIEPLVDTASALARITDACRSAQHSIWIAQLAFDADCVAAGQAKMAQKTLLDVILNASGDTDSNTDKGRNEQLAGVDVRILLNGSILLDTAPALRRAINAAKANIGTRRSRVEVRTVNAFPQVMHAKFVVVDATDVFLTGSSFVNGYWDNARHYPKGAHNASVGSGDRPMHDVCVRISGAAAHEFVRWFDDLWKTEGGSMSQAVHDDMQSLSHAQPHDSPDDAPRSLQHGRAINVRGAVRVVRTTPTRSGRPHSRGRTEILDEYLTAIARAKSFIYLENQYFSARPIQAALMEALRATPELEVILVLNQNPDVTAYRAWQDIRLADGGFLDHPRVGVFAPWSTVPSCETVGRMEMTQVFVHSKVAVIDDAWSTLGTANLDGASLHTYGDDFVRWPGRRIFGGYRNFDINIAVLDNVDGEPATGVSASLRRQLWSKQLGLPEESLRERPPSGWLSMWRTTADAHRSHLATGASGIHGAWILPYVPQARPRRQLQALGIDLDASNIDLRFDPGLVEILWSPGWVKKLVPERIRTWG